jgi:hypothetical protein
MEGQEVKTGKQRFYPSPFTCQFVAADYSNGTISSATMLMILINGLIAGPAVSL